ncbi:MAG: hypothetical protein ACRC2K_01180 [Clostridium sp.]
MSILSKYSKLISRSLDTSQIKESEELKKLLEERNIELNEILIEEKEALEQEDEMIKAIEQHNAEIEKYSKYAQRAISAGDEDGGRRFIDKKYEAEESKADGERKLRCLRDNKQKLTTLKNKIKNDISNIVDKL